MQQEYRQRRGWSEEERQALLEAAQKAVQEHRPIKHVFEQFARKTGRRANSIRNYYYMEQKRLQPDRRPSFIPFDQKELEDLLEAMAEGRAQGKSVRKIALELSGGDERGMLRFQNKYRSILKRNPQLMQGKLKELLEKQQINTQKNEREAILQEKFPAEVKSLFCRLISAGKYGQMLINGLSGLLQYQNHSTEIEETIKKLIKINQDFLKQDIMEQISSLEEYSISLRKCMENLQNG